MNRMKWLATLLASIVLAAAVPAAAHGPTVEITPTGFKPQLLNLFEGTTVHFMNTVTASKDPSKGPSEGVVVTDLAGTFQSPPIPAGGDGWHYTFERSGAHEIRLVQQPDAKLRIVIVKKPAP